jgi:formylglycine-generating enzyme required for sulfatase activity
VHVSWYEAHAFSRWLGQKLGRDVHLPTEAEWEKAARGKDGLTYPWGAEFDAARCNMADTGIGRTSAVGMFPDGKSPCDALDMSGNVLEWCLTKWRATYGESADDDPEGTDRRVLRGGAFDLDAGDVCCAYRRWAGPDYRRYDFGFRGVPIQRGAAPPLISGASGLWKLCALEASAAVR